jgi:hypothetical protein
MVSRQAFYDELQELRTLVLQDDLEQVQLRVRLFIHTCDHLTEPIHSSALGAWRDPPSYAADDVGLSVAWSGPCAVTLPKPGLRLNPIRREPKALDEALRALE